MEASFDPRASHLHILILFHCILVLLKLRRGPTCDLLFSSASVVSAPHIVTGLSAMHFRGDRFVMLRLETLPPLMVSNSQSPYNRFDGTPVVNSGLAVVRSVELFSRILTILKISFAPFVINMLMIMGELSIGAFRSVVGKLFPKDGLSNWGCDWAHRQTARG
jgi:hypothetical protein